MLSLIQARGLTKWRGPRRVLDGLDLDVRQGEVLTILGPNGAGKSTLIGILAGLIRPDAGTVRLFGEDLGRLLPQVYARLGIALQLHGLSPRLTVRETVRFFYVSTEAVARLTSSSNVSNSPKNSTSKHAGFQRERSTVFRWP